ncbi:MAG: tRNA 2-thiouridine(34) synthase MnmA [Parcubacteria group bacterium]|nr:tRNA 2-thiouridine(34) synthase MnmA [Parcubacteria group bacterium]
MKVTGGDKKVFVGMSGGVDSSVAAALLKEAGYDVTGVFIRVWKPDFIECAKTDDESMARRTAAHLGIPFLVFDFAEEYKREVVDYMVREYKAGRTPNPDVMCNKHIKFGLFLQKAREMGADFIATGHYARKSEIRNPKSKISYLLHTAKDKNKDQSYFLWTLGQEQLRRTLFPVGGMEKSEVRKLAKKFGLPNAERRDSQGLCFVGEFPMREFLRHFIPLRRGDVLNEAGEVVGHHDGAFYLTIGQRHGFILTKKTPHDEPHYVVGKDAKANTVTVSARTPEMPGSVSEVALENEHFISGAIPGADKTYRVRYRYRQPLVEAGIKKQGLGISVCFKASQSGVAPGQSLVIYDKNGEECLGGGIIR